MDGHGDTGHGASTCILDDTFDGGVDSRSLAEHDCPAHLQKAVTAIAATERLGFS